MFMAKKIIIQSIVGTMLACCASIVLFFYTNTGFYCLARTVSIFYDANITILKSSGTLARGITISEIKITANNFTTIITDTTIRHSVWHILDLPTLNAKKALFSYGNLNATATDINITEDQNISFKIPSYKTYSNTQLTKQGSGYKVTTELSFADNALKLQGNTKDKTLELISTPKSPINANIKASWQNELSWDISAYDDSQSGSLKELSFYSKGSTNDFVFAINELEGQINAKPLNTHLIYKKSAATSSLNASVEYGKSTATIKFHQASDMLLQSHINIPDLSTIMPELLGSVTADVNVTGTAEKPKANITLSAHDIFQSKVSADSLEADISVNNNINAEVKAIGTRYKNIYKKQLGININGDLDKHTIRMTSEGDTNFASVLEGSYNNQKWTGSITKLTLSDESSSLELAKPDHIIIQKHQITNNDLCFRHNDKSICSNFMFNLQDHTMGASIKTASFELKELSALNFMSDLIDIRSGSMESNISFTTEKNGAVSQKGYFNIKDAELYFKKQNIYPTLSYLNIESSKHTATIEGEMISKNNQKAEISGTIHTQNKPEAKIKIKGEKILINNTQNAQLTISPNITLHLHDYLDIAGKIDVPQANVTIKDDDETTLPSDVIIAGYHDPNSSFVTLGTKTSLYINLLDNISIKVQKIYSKIKGSLLLNASRDGKVLATGTIEAYDGSFYGYGHKLAIERGKLVYDRAPIDAPWLNIEATRTINLDNNDLRSLDNIIVGIIILGNISTPEITLFSNPNKYTENEILSLLLTGSLSSILSDDEVLNNGYDNYSMLIGKNLLESLGILNKLSDKLSLDEISISEDQTSSESPINITMSKDINSRLKLVGSFSLYSDDYSVSALYNINKNIMLKGYINQLSHGLSMLYKFYSD